MQPDAKQSSEVAMPVGELIACHECDALYRRFALPSSARAHCPRCGALLYKHLNLGPDWPLALALAALGLFVIAHVFPFLALQIEGHSEENLVISGVEALWSAGMVELAVLVALTSVVFPLFNILGLLWLLVPLKLGLKPPAAALVLGAIQRMAPWSLLAVFMLGVLVAFVKLLDLATVIPGISLFAFAALMVVATAAHATFRPEYVWPQVASGEHADDGPWVDVDCEAGATAAEQNLMSCHVCTAVTPVESAAHLAADAHPHCRVCGSSLHGHRKENSITRCWALVIAASILIIPANVYPIMTVIQLGRGDPSTIMSGVIYLIGAGMFGLALIVFVASIAVPVAKLGLLIYLLVSVQRRSPWAPAQRTRLYRLTELVGAWSMVDIFIVGVLAALVQLGALATIEPEVGATYFGAVVVVTMFAAQAFDPRLIWDHAVASPRLKPA